MNSSGFTHVLGAMWEFWEHFRTGGVRKWILRNSDIPKADSGQPLCPPQITVVLYNNITTIPQVEVLLRHISAKAE